MTNKLSPIHYAPPSRYLIKPVGQTVRGYVVALTLVIAFVILRGLLSPLLGTNAPLILFLIPVVFSAWYGGFGPGIIATVTSLVLGSTLFIPGDFVAGFQELAVNWLPRGVAFLIVGITISFLAARLEAARSEAKISADEARANETFLRRIMDSSPDCIKVLDLQGTVLSINSRGSTLLEVKDVSTLLNTSWISWWEQGGRVRAAASISEARAGNSNSFIAASPTFAGTPKWWDVAVSPVNGTDGKPERLLCVARDITERRNADLALKQSEELQRKIFESVRDYAIFTTDLVGKITSWNVGAARLFGFSEQESIGKDVSALFTQEDREASSQEHIDAVERGNSRVDRWQLRKDGSRFFASGVVTPLIDENDEVVGFTRVVRDVTEQQNIKQKLADAVRRSDSALIAGEVATFEWDVARDRVFGDENFAKIFSVRLSEDGTAPLSAFTDVIHPDDRLRVEGLIKRSVETGENYECDYRIISNGVERWLVARGRMTKDALGNVVAFPGVVLDVTERKKAEGEKLKLISALEQSEREFRQLADVMPQIVWAARPDGNVDYYNGRWLEYIERSPSELEAAPLRDYVHPADMDETRRAWAESIEKGTSFTNELRIRNGKGEYRWFLVRAVPIRNTAGQISRWFGTCTDIQDQKEVQSQKEVLLGSERSARSNAEHASRMKDDFLATLSHELRTPLNAIFGWTQLLKRGKGEAKIVAEAVDVIDRNVRMQTQLIDDLLDMSRIISGKIRLDIKPVDLEKCIDAAIETVLPAATTKGIRIDNSFVQLDRPIPGDSGRIRQVIWNLLSNAIKFTPKGGVVSVQVKVVDSFAEISVTDTGQGIETQFLPFIFDRFRQADSSTNRKHGGLGLGLAIVKQMVELHGGTVSVQSEGLGKGTTFVVSFPLVSSQRSEADAHKTDSKLFDAPVSESDFANLSGLKILVVDDERDARELLRRVLLDCDAKVLTAGSAADGLQLIKSDLPDLLISDIGMPDKDGYDFIRAVRKLSLAEGRDTPAIALTAFARAEDKMKALDAGFAIHMTKPVEPSKLVATVARVVGRPEATAQS